MLDLILKRLYKLLNFIKIVIVDAHCILNKDFFEFGFGIINFYRLKQFCNR